MDILIDIQSEYSCVTNEVCSFIADRLNISQADIEQTLSFYHFFSKKDRGKFTIYLNDSVVAKMMGSDEVAKAFEEAVGCEFGQLGPNGFIGLYKTSCIGMSDQEPAALINNIPFTKLTPFRAKEIINDIKVGKKLEDIVVEGSGDSKNSHPLINAMVNNNIRKIGPVLDKKYEIGSAIKSVIKMKPDEVIKEIKFSSIRGRGGAGFPTGLKWELCRKAKGKEKYIFCNADEGEPGTFKDRVLLTERPRLMFEGMVIAGYAIGATKGILYIRHEYKYLQGFLESILEEARKNKYLGKNILGKKGFNFDIRIQFGAGAYVCGEESALIESAEGKRGEPRDRPPFPVESGYLNCPTVVNNVETLCSVTKVILNGATWYRSFGTKKSSGTKVLSISGDCPIPGIYEVEWGFTVNEILKMIGAKNVQAVQVGGPSGTLIAPNKFNRTLSYEDLSTGGSLVIIGPERDLLRDIVLGFMDFFIEESCGSCVPCRALTIQFKAKLLKILEGNGVLQDIEDIEDWAPWMLANRCGLGHTAINPIIRSLKNFRHLYESLIQEDKDFDSSFDLKNAVKESCQASGRIPK